jgi:hypothetical protein
MLCNLERYIHLVAQFKLFRHARFPERVAQTLILRIRFVGNAQDKLYQLVLCEVVRANLNHNGEELLNLLYQMYFIFYTIDNLSTCLILFGNH